MGGRWRKEMEEKEDSMERTYGAVEPVLKEAWVMRMVTEKGGLSSKMLFPSSTMEIRWPMPGDGYSTMVSSISISISISPISLSRSLPALNFSSYFIDDERGSLVGWKE
ncbi:hypothetical protein MRB53_030095 [Persea americana]|uniref:Uncharacterized protein n=1 Tax=Persea americana TaxID=3435 RepID=A0ACC2KK87_PERAE|nr:hypothetical protein MRB53_030095 [Persea americana]